MLPVSLFAMIALAMSSLVAAAPMPMPPAHAHDVVVPDPYLVASERDDAIVAPIGSRKRGASPSAAGRSKLQVGRDMFAYASRTVW